MNSNNTHQTQSGAAQCKPRSAEDLTETITQQVTKGLSQPPSRSQVPPATAAEEIVP